MNEEQILKKEFPQIIKKESLSKHTSICVGGPAKLFYTAKILDHLIKIVKKSQELDYPYIVIGGGCNIIASDAGFVGLVVQNQCAGLVCEKEKAIVESGIYLSHLIKKLAEQDLGGLEFLSGIPGTLGGAVYGNAGAFGKSIGDIINFVLPLVTAGAGILFLVMLLYGAFTWMTAGEKADNVAKASKTITFAIVGLVFIVLSYTLVKLISAIFGVKDLPF